MARCQVALEIRKAVAFCCLPCLDILMKQTNYQLPLRSRSDHLLHRVQRFAHKTFVSRLPWLGSTFFVSLPRMVTDRPFSIRQMPRPACHLK